MQTNRRQARATERAARSHRHNGARLVALAGAVPGLEEQDRGVAERVRDRLQRLIGRTDAAAEAPGVGNEALLDGLRESVTVAVRFAYCEVPSVCCSSLYQTRSTPNVS